MVLLYSSSQASIHFSEIKATVPEFFIHSCSQMIMLTCICFKSRRLSCYYRPAWYVVGLVPIERCLGSPIWLQIAFHEQLWQKSRMIDSESELFFMAVEVSVAHALFVPKRLHKKLAPLGSCGTERKKHVRLVYYDWNNPISQKMVRNCYSHKEEAL